MLRATTERLGSMGFDEAVVWVVPANNDDTTAADDVLGTIVTDRRYRRRLR